MPSGKTHDKINTAFLFPFLIGMAFVGFISLKLALFFTFGYLFGTFLLGPDLDTKSSSYNRWGIFRFIWKPYRKIFIHRSIFTHLPIIGDVIRILYFGCWVLLLVILPSYIIEAHVSFEQVQLKEYVQLKYILMAVILLVGVSLVVNRPSKEIPKNRQRKYIQVSKWIAALYVVAITYNISSDYYLNYELVSLYEESQIEVWFIPLGIILASAVHILSDVMVSSMKQLKK